MKLQAVFSVVAASEGDPPVFMADGALQSFDEAIGPRPPWLCACMCNFKVLAGQIEVSLELAALVGEHTFDWPSCFGEGAGEITEEASRFLSSQRVRSVRSPAR